MFSWFSWLRQFNLTAALGAAALVDLVFGRILTRMLLPNARLTAGANAALLGLSSFVGHLVTLLAAVLVLASVLPPARSRPLAPPQVRIAFLCISLVFVLMSLVTLFDGRFLPHARIAHAFVSLFLCLGILAARLPLRMRLSGLLLALPSMVFTLLMVAQKRRWPWAEALMSTATWLALGSWVLAFPLLARRRNLHALVVAPAILLAAAAAGFLFQRFDAAATALLQGLALDLPRPDHLAGQLMAVLLAAGVASVALTVFSLAWRPETRLSGYGVALIAAAGLHPGIAAAGVSLVGLLALSRGLRSAASIGAPKPRETRDRGETQNDVDAGHEGVPTAPATPT